MMSHKHKDRHDRRAFDDQFDVEDRQWITDHSRAPGDSKEGRKARQLCRQVSDTLDLVLSGDCRDEVLQSLRVISVLPAPNSSRLLVTVAADLPIEQFDRRQILDALDDQAGRLRAEVAATIHRKRVPVLVFNVVGPLPYIPSIND